MSKGRMCTRSQALLVLCAAALLSPTATTRADELSDLRDQLEANRQKTAELENRIGELEAGQEHKEHSTSAKTEEPEQSGSGKGPTDLRAYWKDGLRLETLDKNFQLRIGGRVQNDWIWVTHDDAIEADVGDQEAGTEFRRVRLYVQGLVHGDMEYKVQLDFAGGATALKDVYLGLIDFPIGRLRVGHFKEPFSLEELTSSKYITFLERALPNTFVPSRNAGFMLHNTALEDRATWAVGLFRDTDDTGMNIDEGGYNITGRITALPMYKNRGASLLHLGAAYSYRNPDDSLRYRARPEAHLLDRFVDTGTLASDQVDLLGLEAAWINGPFSLQAEYVFADADRLGGASGVDFDAYYVQGSYFLTGEHRNYKTSSGAFDRLRPKRNFGFGGGPGAWEITARYSEIDLNDVGVSGGRLSDVTAGLNWYPNPNMRVMWNYVHADKDGVGEADIFLTRFQFDF